LLSTGGTFALTQAGDASFTHNATLGALETQASGSVYVLGGPASTQVSATGPVKISAGGDLRINGGAEAGAFAALKSYSDIDVTLGGTLRINAGSGNDAYARLQTASRDSAINLHFVNSSSGGYFVNDIEGALRRGHSGIVSGEGVAVPKHTLFVTYGQ